MKFLKKFLLLVFLLYLLLNIFIYFFQEKLIFFPIKISQNTKIENEVSFRTEDDIKLYGKFKNNNSEKVILFFHGNGGNVEYEELDEILFDRLGLSYLIFDYRSYGKSEGEIKWEKDLYFDSLAAYSFLKSKKYEDKSIILWGHSLGGAVATDFNSKIGKKFNILVLDSTFDSMLSMANEKYPICLNSIFLKYKFETDKKINNIKNKILFIHGKNDKVISYKYSQKLFNFFEGEKEYLLTKGSHNKSFFKENQEFFENKKKIEKILLVK